MMLGTQSGQIGTLNPYPTYRVVMAGPALAPCPGHPDQVGTVSS